MILAALLLAVGQAVVGGGVGAVPPATAPAQTQAAPSLKPVRSTLAFDTFKAVCWAAFRDPALFDVAVAGSPMPLTRGPAGGAGGDSYTSDRAILTYVASDTLPANVPSRQCRLRVALGGSADQLTLAAGLATALALPPGSTRSGPAHSRTTWDVPEPDGRITRVILATQAASGGQTGLTLSALLLSPR